MITISRYVVPEASVADFVAGAEAALAALSVQDGYDTGSLARATDDPDVWVLVSHWQGAGRYRRALGAMDVRMALMPLQVFAVDETGAFEVVASATDGDVTHPDTDMAAGWAAGPGPIRRDRARPGPGNA